MTSRLKRERFSRSARKAAWVTVVMVTWCLWPGIVRGEADLEIRGNRVLSDDAIRDLAGPRGWVVNDENRVLRRIQEAYIAHGHLFAEIRIQRDPKDSTVVLLIDEGEVARFGQITIEGVTRHDLSRIRDVIGIREGDAFNPGVVDAGVQELLDLYDRGGYPFAQVWIDSLGIEPETSRVRLSVHVVEGGPKELGRVSFEGLQKTREEVAIRLSGLNKGEPYDGDAIRSAYLRLSASGVFDDVAYPTIRMSPQGEGVEALIKVIEPKRSNNFAAALGYAEREGDQDRVLSGTVRLDLLNIGGSLRDLNVFWQNDGAGRIQTQLTFHQRFFLGGRTSLGLSLEQIGQDTVYTWQSVGVEMAAPVGRIWDGLLGIDFMAHGDRNTFAQGETSKSLRLRTMGGFSFVRGREHRGTLLGLESRYAYARKKLDGREDVDPESVSQHIVEAKAKLALELPRHFHLVNETVFKNLSSREAEVPLSEQYYLGGAATVRGYRENQFHSRRVAFSRSEILIGRSRAENGYVFADVGYYLQHDRSPVGEITTRDRFVFGHGFGLRTRSRAGNIDLSFAVGPEFTLRQTKIHVILNRTF